MAYVPSMLKCWTYYETHAKEIPEMERDEVGIFFTALSKLEKQDRELLREKYKTGIKGQNVHGRLFNTDKAIEDKILAERHGLTVTKYGLKRRLIEQHLSDLVLTIRQERKQKARDLLQAYALRVGRFWYVQAQRDMPYLDVTLTSFPERAHIFHGDNSLANDRAFTKVSPEELEADKKRWR